MLVLVVVVVMDTEGPLPPFSSPSFKPTPTRTRIKPQNHQQLLLLVLHKLITIPPTTTTPQIMKRDLNAGLGGGAHCDELAGRFLDGLFRFFPHGATRAGALCI